MNFESQEQFKNTLPQRSAEKKDQKKSLAEIYKPIFDARTEYYAKDIKTDPKQERGLSNLEVHNNIVLGYAKELTETLDLSPKDKAAALIATILHDSGKLSSSLMEHHEQGSKYAGEIIDNLIGQKFEGVIIDESLKTKVQEAIIRHMNHPFLVNLQKGKRFPEPQDNVDRIVFDADMMANGGFKNVAFRLNSEANLQTDTEKARAKGISILQESFENVLVGVTELPNVVLTKPAKTKMREISAEVIKIKDYLNKHDIFQKIQDLFSANGTFSKESIDNQGGFPLIKKILNEEIHKAGLALQIDSQRLKNYFM